MALQPLKSSSSPETPTSVLLPLGFLTTSRPLSISLSLFHFPSFVCLATLEGSRTPVVFLFNRGPTLGSSLSVVSRSLSGLNRLLNHSIHTLTRRHNPLDP
ncbi:hypothetical protein CRG98_041044 [Punica granatum]|uniref:Uncharacterized protein n=1 Tax=Punica granatum TaxID=22663 RepID=A0A2I0I3S7_PUNGR|nr:hypothetical protein CRG98_041044 [Punica granatum]